MPTQTLIVAGALIFGLLGTVHLAYTLFTGMFSPRDATTEAAMKLTHPRLTRRTTLWKAWVGFNASHSLGLITFGLVYGYLALAHPQEHGAAPPPKRNERELEKATRKAEGKGFLTFTSHPGAKVYVDASGKPTRVVPEGRQAGSSFSNCVVKLIRQTRFKKARKDSVHSATFKL